MVDFTVAIPTYNGATRLPMVLEQLRSQVNLDRLAWEVIVVDNNSQDDTAAVVQSFQANFPCPLRYCLEVQQGVAFARQCAIQAAHSELIGFLDDDNLPDLDWVANAYEFAQTHPAAGAFGSQIHGNFEVTPPPHFKRIQAFLAIIERGSQSHRYEYAKKMLPPAAALVIRRQAWLDAVPTQTLLVGRVGGKMVAGEDTEALAYLQRSGWEIWYNPAMQVTHQIPSERLERSYLIRCVRGIGLSRHVIRMVRVKPWQQPFMLVAYAISDLRKLISHLVKYRSQLKTDLVAACELELYFSILISPFYLWRNGYFSRAK